MVKTVRYSSNGLGIVHYLRERFQLFRFGPLVLMLFLGHLVNTRGHETELIDIITLGLLTLAFRLLDDLFDRTHDRRLHPTRVLVQADDLYPFIRFLLLLLITIFLVLYYSAGVTSIIILSLTLLGAVVWYHLLRRRLKSKILHSFVILLKYPIFLIALAPGLYEVITLILLYLTFVIFELLDDPVLRQSRRAQHCRYGATAGYLTLILLKCVPPLFSTSTGIVFGVSALLQGLIVFQPIKLTRYLIFVNTTFIFCFFIMRYILI